MKLKLSMLAGVEWELHNGNFSASGYNYSRDKQYGGQCLDELVKDFPKSKLLKRIHKVWQRWHLNSMKAGCEHQRAEKWEERKIDESKPLKDYGLHFKGQRFANYNMLSWVRTEDHPQGLLGKACETCGYKYGTAWLTEELPADVVAEIQSWENDEEYKNGQ